MAQAQHRKHSVGSIPSPLAQRNPTPTPAANAPQTPHQGKAENEARLPSHAHRYNEERRLYDFAEELYKQDPPVEPWFLEMSRLRRVYILWINKQLALCRKKLLERQQPTDDDMRVLGEVLHLQAEAVRDLQSIRSLDFMTSSEQDRLHQRTCYYFPETARSLFGVEPFKTENYRRFRPAKEAVIFDGVRDFLRNHLPAWISWPKDEKKAREDLYREGIYAPEGLSDTADRLARFIVAMGGALFILVPMYIMALGPSSNKNLITTTVAVVLFALVCSIPLRLANDQTFSATVGYAAVLMVFVGLTSASPSL